MSPLNENELVFNQAVRMAALIHKMREKEPLQPAEQQELADWLNSNETNTPLLESLQNREQLTAELEALMQYDDNQAVSAIFDALGEQRPPAIKKGKIISVRLLAAASVLLVFGMAAWYIIAKTKSSMTVFPSLPDETITYTTKPGQQRRLALADGSEVWLNAASSIKYPARFAGNAREVTITGEAFFSVAKDKTKPFIVTANNMKVEVTGTQFDVMAYNDEDATTVTLVEGSVKVGRRQTADGKQEGKGQRAKGKGQKIEDSEEVVLKPGEQAELAATDSPLTIHHSPNVEDILAWRSGEFRFHETSMTAIMRQVARWYNVTIAYKGAVDTIHFSGQISRKENIKELLDILSDTRKVHFEIKEEKNIVVIPGHK